MGVRSDDVAAAASLSLVSEPQRSFAAVVVAVVFASTEQERRSAGDEATACSVQVRRKQETLRGKTAADSEPLSREEPWCRDCAGRPGKVSRHSGAVVGQCEGLTVGAVDSALHSNYNYVAKNKY
ncbi:hypothetical protein MTO96_015943 [Rhipicephalus appendiculatus]